MQQHLKAGDSPIQPLKLNLSNHQTNCTGRPGDQHSPTQEIAPENGTKENGSSENGPITEETALSLQQEQEDSSDQRRNPPDDEKTSIKPCLNSIEGTKVLGNYLFSI